MIYFDRMLQERALALFKDSLCRRGFLGLGSRESLRFTSHERDFTGLADRWYRRC
jgi:chemotaxis protein methyltransferase CheR